MNVTNSALPEVIICVGRLKYNTVNTSENSPFRERICKLSKSRRDRYEFNSVYFTSVR